jgi:polyhydroxyalkanoate synthesis regulator phasin
MAEPRDLPSDGHGSSVRQFSLEQSPDVPIDIWLDLVASVECGNCLETIELSQNRMYSGRCGHSICGKCFSRLYERGKYASAKLLPCPYTQCKDKHYCFQRVPNYALNDSISRLQEMRSRCIWHLRCKESEVIAANKEKDRAFEATIREKMMLVASASKSKVQELQAEIERLQAAGEEKERIWEETFREKMVIVVSASKNKVQELQSKIESLERELSKFKQTRKRSIEEVCEEVFGSVTSCS